MTTTRQATAPTTTCRDCGGPLTQAFAASGNYDRCRRCGHIFPAADRIATQDELEAAGLDTRTAATGTEDGVTAAPIRISRLAEVVR